MNENQPIVVNLPEGQNTLTLLKGEAPKRLDDLKPVKIDIVGSISAPLNFLQKRVGDIDQHKSHILVNRDSAMITLIVAEDDAYNQGTVKGTLKYSDIFVKLGINTEKEWQPERLGQFLKLNRSFFESREENLAVVSALKQFNAKVNQSLQRETNEKGNRALSFRQVVDSNIPEKFRLKIPVFSGGELHSIEVETYANVDGQDVTIMLQSAGANDVLEVTKRDNFDAVLGEIQSIAPDIVIIEQ